MEDIDKTITLDKCKWSAIEQLGKRYLLKWDQSKGNIPLEVSMGREISQNSIDARDDETLPVKMKVSTGKFEDLKLGEKLYKEIDVLRKEFKNGKFDYFLLEDFNTTGMEGHPGYWGGQLEDGSKNAIYAFLDMFGMSVKDKGEGGSEGEGRQSYFLNSRVKTFFFYNIPKKTKIHQFMGLCQVDENEIVSKGIEPLATFGLLQDSINEPHGKPKKIHIGLTDENDLEEIRKAFKMHRTKEPGLSIIIVYLREDFDKEKFMTSILDNYRLSILKGDYEIDFWGQTVTGENLLNILIEKEPLKQFHYEDYFRFIEETTEALKRSQQEYLIKWPKPSIVHLRPECFTKEERKEIKETWDRQELIIFRNEETVIAKKEENSGKKIFFSYRIFMKKASQDGIGLDDVVRGIMPISGERKWGNGNARKNAHAYVSIQEHEAVKFFQCAESANHLTFNSTNPKLEENYRGTREELEKKIARIIRIQNELYTMINNESSDRPDYTTSADWFANPDAEGDQESDELKGEKKDKDKDKKKKKIKVEKITKNPEMVTVDPSEDGFNIKGIINDEVKNFMNQKKIKFPIKFIVKLAHKKEKSNSIRAYSKKDFDINDYDVKRTKDSNLSFDLMDNQITIKANSLDFLLKIRGLESRLGEWVCSVNRVIKKEKG